MYSCHRTGRMQVAALRTRMLVADGSQKWTDPLALQAVKQQDLSLITDMCSAVLHVVR